MAVPYTFGNATTSIPLAQLDTNFATAITLGNTSVQLGNTITNLTGVTNIASGSSLTVGSNGNTTAMYIDTSQNVGIGTTSPQVPLDVQGSSAQFRVINGIDMRMYPYTAGSAGIAGTWSNHAYVLNTNNIERMRIDTSGNLLVGTTSALGKFTSVASGTSAAAVLQSQNTYTGLSVGNISGTAGYNAGLFYNNGFSSAVGSIYVSGTSTAFNTSSDYRLKTNVTPLTTTQSGPVIDALKPSQFTWKEDNTPDVGFIAHEMQAVIPRAVTGEKDAVDAEGKPVYQQVAVSSPEIIAYLVAEIQSLRARLKAANIA